MTQSKIYVLGSINLDISISTSKIPQPAETVAGSSLLLTPGKRCQSGIWDVKIFH